MAVDEVAAVLDASELDRGRRLPPSGFHGLGLGPDQARNRRSRERRVNSSEQKSQGKVSRTNMLNIHEHRVNRSKPSLYFNETILPLAKIAQPRCRRHVQPASPYIIYTHIITHNIMNILYDTITHIITQYSNIQ